MARQVKLRHLEEFEYPVERETVVEGTRDVTVELADGIENLGDLVAESSDDTFESVSDIFSEVMNRSHDTPWVSCTTPRGNGRSMKYYRFL